MPRENETGIDAAARVLAAVELRKKGFAYRVIAQHLSYSTPEGAHRAVTDALKATLTEACDELRTLECERLDAMWAGIAEKAVQGDTFAIDRALRIMERRAKLTGIDAPVKIAPTTPDGSEEFGALSEADKAVRIAELLARGLERAQAASATGEESASEPAGT